MPIARLDPATSLGAVRSSWQTGILLRDLSWHLEP
jgi:hypothetical protein